MDTDELTALFQPREPHCPEPPADPKWREHKWQSYHESRADYIKHLLDNITDCKAYIQSMDDFSTKHIEVSDDVARILTVEKEMLAEYQEEFRKVVQG